MLMVLISFPLLVLKPDCKLGVIIDQEMEKNEPRLYPQDEHSVLSEAELEKLGLRKQAPSPSICTRIQKIRSGVSTIQYDSWFVEVGKEMVMKGMMIC